MEKGRTALLSAYHKDEPLRILAARLVEMGWKLLASTGTKKFLDEHGIPSKDIADIVGPSILGHRVVTLSREIHAALLARTDSVEDLNELARIGIEPIELVYVDLYPLAEALADPDRTEASVREKIDIGGPTLLRAAAKAGRYVLWNSRHLISFLDFLDSGHENNPLPIRSYQALLAAGAEAAVKRYAELAQEFYESLLENSFDMETERLKREALLALSAPEAKELRSTLPPVGSRAG